MSISILEATAALTVLLSIPTTSIVAAAPLPWSLVNGAGKGYAIKLGSASPEPGSGVRVGQSVEFKVDLSYQLDVVRVTTRCGRFRRSAIQPTRRRSNGWLSRTARESA
jgi:hypothetical protein